MHKVRYECIFRESVNYRWSAEIEGVKWGLTLLLFVIGSSGLVFVSNDEFGRPWNWRLIFVAV
jgi:hypothetical protein